MGSESTQSAGDDERNLSDFLNHCDVQERKNEVKRDDNDEGDERL